MRQVLLGNANHGLVRDDVRLVFIGTNGTDLINVAKYNLFDSIVLQDFANDTAIATSDNQHLLRVWMRSKGKMRNHLLIAMLS